MYRIGWVHGHIYVYRWTAIAFCPRGSSPYPAISTTDVHKTVARGQNATSYFTTIQSDKHLTPHAPSLKHAWLRNPFSVIYPGSQIKTCLIIEGKLKRGHIFTIQQSTNLSTSDPPLTPHLKSIHVTLVDTGTVTFWGVWWDKVKTMK